MFRSRYSDDESYFSGNGTLYNKRIWETNFIPNAPDMALYGWKERGAGGINAMLQMGKNDMGNHISEFPIGTYKKAHRHGPGAHLFLLSGDSGFSLLWTKPDRSDMMEVRLAVGHRRHHPRRGHLPPALQFRDEARPLHGPARR